MSTTASQLKLDRAPRPDRVAGRKLLWAAPLSGALAAVANLLVLGLASGLLGQAILIVMPIAPGPVQVQAFQVALMSFLPALAAGLLLWALGKLTARPFRWFTIVSVIVLVLSFAPSWMLDVDTGSKLWLSVMHVVAAVVIVAGLYAWARDKS